MITLVEALNYRCFKYIRQPLGPFHVLVGPNASGKTTFLDIIAFLGRLVSDGLEAAIDERTSNFYDLIWGREGRRFELAVEASIPEDHWGTSLPTSRANAIRYEVAIGVDDGTGELGLLSEAVLLKFVDMPPATSSLHEGATDGPDTIITRNSDAGVHFIVTKHPESHDEFYPEAFPSVPNITPDGKHIQLTASFRLGSRKSAFRNLPEDESAFPGATWLKSLLTGGLRRMMLNVPAMRQASPPSQTRELRPDGANLPWAVERLRLTQPERYTQWTDHVRAALPDIAAIRTVEREDDRHSYLMVRHTNGVEVPSWMVSDGTLRLLALTLTAYLADSEGIYLIEEPENGIHPRAVHAVFDSLSSVYGSQVLLATHAPGILGIADIKTVLCFARTPDGAAQIVRGDLHPRLRDWRGEEDLGVLFAAGILG